MGEWAFNSQISITKVMWWADGCKLLVICFIHNMGMYKLCSAAEKVYQVRPNFSAPYVPVASQFLCSFCTSCVPWSLLLMYQLRPKFSAPYVPVASQFLCSLCTSCVTWSLLLVYQLRPELSAPLLRKYCSCVPSARLRTIQRHGKNPTFAPPEQTGKRRRSAARDTHTHTPHTHTHIHTHTHTHTHRGTAQPLTVASVNKIERNRQGRERYLPHSSLSTTEQRRRRKSNQGTLDPNRH